METYQDPDAFIANINNTIQGLRNITFILQSEKDRIPDFDTWYSRWQVLMGEESVMRWLVEARNRVVHRGDLETKSIATVSILTHDDHEALKLSFDPFTTLVEIADGVIKHQLIQLPPIIKNEGVLSFERKWVVNEFPEADLIDLLIYCYGILLSLVRSAHERCKSDFFSCEKNSWNKADAHNVLYILHVRAKEHRFLKMRCSDDSIITVSVKKFDETNIEKFSEGLTLEDIEKRYGSIKDMTPEEGLPNNEPFPFDQAGFFIGMAKRSLRVDKTLYSNAFVYSGDDNKTEMISLLPHDRSELYVSIEKLADMVEERGAHAIILSYEAWVYALENLEAMRLDPEKVKDKTEAIVILIATPKRTSQYHVPFSREATGEIKFGKLLFTKDERPPILGRVYSVWDMQHPPRSRG